MDLESVIRSEIDRIAKKLGLQHNYQLLIPADESLATFHGNLVDVRLEAGDPPKMIIPMLFIFRTMLAEKPNVILFRDRVQRALEKYPRMTRTLLNNIPRDRALILYKDARSWVKTHAEPTPLAYHLPDEDLEITFSATVRDKITGISFTAFANNSKDALIEARGRVSNVIGKTEELERFREMVKEMQQMPKLEDKSKEPSTILITTEIVHREQGDSEQINEVRNYDSNQS